MLRLPDSFYQSDDVVNIARTLLGKTLITKMNGVITSGIITETEAYHQSEKACHAYNGRRTARTEVLFETGGISYVYLCYGIHSLFNVVTGKQGEAAAVLIRAIEPQDGLSMMMKRRGLTRSGFRISAGPGMLSQALGLTLKNNRDSLVSGSGLWIETGKKVSVTQIATSKRIGVEYAREDALLPWRFFLNNSDWVSRV